MIFRKVDENVYANYFFRLLIRTGGITENESEPRVAVAASITLMCLVSFLGCYIGSINATNSDVIIPVVVGNTVIFMYHWTIKLHEKVILQFTRLLQDPDPPLQSRATNMEVIRLFRNTAPVLLISSGLLLFFGGSPVLLPVFFQYDLRNSLRYIFPSWFACTNSGQNNFPVRVLCVDVTTYKKYIFMNLLAFGVVIFLVLYWGLVWILYVLTQIFLKTHLNVLLERIAKLSEEPRNSTCMANEQLWRVSEGESGFCWVRYGQCRAHHYNRVKEEIIGIIRYYQYMRRIIKDIVPIYCTMVHSALLTLFPMVLYLTFNVLQMSQGADQLMYKAKAIFAIGYQLVVFMTVCNGAEKIKDLSEQVSLAIYNIPWYNVSPKLRKTVLLVLLQSQRSETIKAFKMYPTNLKFFMIILRNIYSALNIMLKMRN